jgi:PAS domain S-box-containing protein
MEVAMVDILKNKPHLFDTIQVAFLLTDVHSNVLYTNRQAQNLFGYKKEEIEGQRVRILFLEEDMIYLLPNIIYLTLYKEGFEGEALLRRRDGTKIFVHLVTSSFKEEGEVFLTFSFQEIQRLKRLEREKVEAERWASLGRMVEEIAHQIRNPITSIGGYAKRLLKAFPSAQKARPYLDRILRETRRLEVMIHRVEEYIKIPRPNFQKENIQEVAEAALQTVSDEMAEKGIFFRLETTGLKSEGSLYVDKGLLILALSHLFRNSMEAMTSIPSRKRKKEVRVELLEAEEEVGVSITDRGEGIAKKDLGHIFEPFFSTRPEQIGLGLTFVRRVMEEHGGRIQVNSRLKKGTTVTLLFQKDRRRKIRRELLSPEASA